MKYLKGKITLGESRGRGFVCKVGDYSIIDAGSVYVVTNKNGKTVYETKNGIPVIKDYIEDCIAKGIEVGSENPIKEDVEETLPDVVPEEPIVVSSEVEGIDPVLENNAIASVINALIIDEFEAVEGYNNAISTLTVEDVVKYGDAINVLNDILNEENIHIGQLQEVLKQVSDSASSIETGKEEAKGTLDDTEKVVDEPVQEEGLNESGVDNLARMMGKKLLPPKKTPKARYVYEIYWFDTEDCRGDAIFKKFWTKKAQEEWYEAHKNDPDKFSMYMEDGYNMYEGLDCNSKVVCINEEQGSMKEKVVSTTRNFTKEKGQIICNKGAQQEEVEALLKPHYSNVEVTKAKGGSVNIKYSK